MHFLTSYTRARTLGRYDSVTIIEAPSEKEAMKARLLFQDVVETENFVDVPWEEALKLICIQTNNSHFFRSSQF